MFVGAGSSQSGAFFPHPALLSAPDARSRYGNSQRFPEEERRAARVIPSRNLSGLNREAQRGKLPVLEFLGFVSEASLGALSGSLASASSLPPEANC